VVFLMGPKKMKPSTGASAATTPERQSRNRLIQLSKT
jgi:hypothetical protein